MGRTTNHQSTVTTPAEGIRVRQWASGKTTLQVDFHLHGMRCREALNLKASAANIKYAERLRAEVLNAIERGNFDYRKYFPKSKNLHLFYSAENTITIGELLTEFLAQSKKTLRHSTYLGYKKKTDKYLLPKFDTLPVRELTAAILRRWIKPLPLTTKTVNNILTPLRAVISTALEDEIIDKNPLQHIVVNKLLDRKTSKSKYKVDPMSQEEISAILKTAEGQLRNFFQFAFFSGLRTSELLALEWQDIDWVHGQIYITRTLVEGIEEEETKTEKSRRTVLILPPALEALKAQKPFTFLIGKKIFHDPIRNQPWENPHQVRDRWKVVLRRAGVRYRNPYQTRHTYASTLLSKGENMMWVAQQMGHVNTQMIMKTYGRWLPDSNALGGYALKNDWASYVKLENECHSSVTLNGKKSVNPEKSSKINQL